MSYKGFNARSICILGFAPRFTSFKQNQICTQMIAKLSNKPDNLYTYDNRYNKCLKISFYVYPLIQPQLKPSKRPCFSQVSWTSVLRNWFFFQKFAIIFVCWYWYYFFLSYLTEVHFFSEAGKQIIDACLFVVFQCNQPLKTNLKITHGWQNNKIHEFIIRHIQLKITCNVGVEHFH